MNLVNLVNLVILVILANLVNLVNLVILVNLVWSGHGHVARIISSQKIYDLYGLKHHMWR